MFKIKHDIDSLAASVKPGLHALVASNLDKYIDEAVEDFRRKIIQDLAPVLEERVEAILLPEYNKTKVDVVVDVRLGERK